MAAIVVVDAVRIMKPTPHSADNLGLELAKGAI